MIPGDEYSPVGLYEMSLVGIVTNGDGLFFKCTQTLGCVARLRAWCYSTNSEIRLNLNRINFIMQKQTPYISLVL